MPMTYPIVEVRQKWVLEQEAMGSKEKFWYLAEGETTKWLFKYPRENSGEHWAEKIAAEVADLLGISHGRVELAVFEGRLGSVTETFVGDGQELVHGNQILAGAVWGYDPSVKRGQSDHTLENIWRALEKVFEGVGAVGAAKRQFAEYLILDAIIGNTDRHHENWGIVRKWTGEDWVKDFAPSFDHASSLGRELSDEKRDGRLAEKRMDDYIDRGHGGIYWSQCDKYGRSPLELARLAVQIHPTLFRPAIDMLKKLDVSSLQGIVDRVPEDWMSPSARNFAVTLMRHNAERIRGFVE